MAVAATTVKKPSENSPIKRASRRRCERKQTPQNRVIAKKEKSWEKTVEADCLLRKRLVARNRACCSRATAMNLTFRSRSLRVCQSPR